MPEPAEWLTRESWSATGDVHELRKAYEGFHPDVRAVLEACPDCHKWAILEREPLPTLERRTRRAARRRLPSDDAVHGAGRGDGDGGCRGSARCLADVDGEDVEGAFARYEAHRKPRTSRIQAISSANTWMKGGNDDTSWLYGYDAWNVPLTPGQRCDLTLRDAHACQLASTFTRPTAPIAFTLHRTAPGAPRSC